MKYNNFLFASLVVICFIFAALNANVKVNANEFGAVVSDHELIITPTDTTVISGKNAVVNIKIKNTDEEKIFIKLETEGIPTSWPTSWVSYENEIQLFHINPDASENTKLIIHIPEGRIGDYEVKVITRNPDTKVEVIKTLKVAALPPKDKGMSGLPIFPLAQQPTLLLLDIIHLILNGIVNVVSEIF